METTLNTGTTPTERPPANTLRVEAWRDVPGNKDWQTYRVTPPEGEAHVIRLRKNNRRILEAPMSCPVLAASPVRLSDVVHNLKHGYGLNIETKMYDNDTATDRAKFGVYSLIDQVELIDGEVAA